MARSSEIPVTMRSLLATIATLLIVSCSVAHADAQGVVVGTGGFSDGSPSGTAVFFSVAIANGQGRMVFRDPGQTGARYSVVGTPSSISITGNTARVEGTCEPPDAYGPAGACVATFIDGGEGEPDRVTLEFDRYVHSAELGYGELLVQDP